MSSTGRASFVISIASLVLMLLFLFPRMVRADVVINILTVNPKDEVIEKKIEYSLPGEVKPEDVLDPAGLQIDYHAKDAGYYLHGVIKLAPKETRTLKVKVKDVWRIDGENVDELKQQIERGYQEMGKERDPENAAKLHQKLVDKLDYIVNEEAQAGNSIDARIDTYRNHVQTLSAIREKAQLIDYWRTDANIPDPNKTVNYLVEVKNPTDKTKKVKERHYLPKEVRPEYVIDRKGFEIRFDEQKGQAFLFKEDDFAPGEVKKVSIGIQDMWFIPENELKYARDHAKYIMNDLQRSQFLETAKTLYNDVINNLDLIDSLQTTEQPGIEQHIGAYRINQKRFQQVKDDLDALEKLLSRFRSDLEKSRVKNVMQKIQSLKSLSRVSEAIFDKRPTVNAAWKLIGGVMIFLGIFTIIHFVTWFIRSSKEKKQEEVKYSQKKDEAQA